MNNSLTQVALRYRAVFLDIDRRDIDLQSAATVPVTAFVAQLKANGYSVSEELLHALNAVPTDTLDAISGCIDEVMGVKLNWAPLVKGWKLPTGETLTDHLVTLFANILGGESTGLEGTTLPCGHFIPEGTFPLERYNGCPFCGRQFETADFVYTSQSSKLKELRLFTGEDLKQVFVSLLSSATPLDATQKDSLSLLLALYPLPENVVITMKETAMLVVKSLVAQNKAQEATTLLRTPTDVLRYLWYEKTGSAQIIEPRTLVAHAAKLHSHMFGPLDKGADAAKDMKQKLMLKYDRKSCQRVARWLNALPMTAQQAAENMNPKRGMWVRMIHALRLGEYSRKKGMEHLAEILDVFYKQDYTTWQGRVDKARDENDPTRTLALLQERPGLFARCLFATMLRFGSKPVLTAFAEVAERLPARLLLSLGNAAETYFDTREARLARPITGSTRLIEHNKLLALYDEDARQQMVRDVMAIYVSTMERRFASEGTASKTLYIDPELYHIPVSIGDRATTIQDTSCALMGTRFPIEGDTVRLFLQWGKGLPAQLLDMDLSCFITLPDNQREECNFNNLTCIGARHSGDIQMIPDQVGTAEYIELNLPELEEAHARYVTFVCNAYSCGSLSPNLVVGWMDSANPMEVSEEKGVAYDPSCVQHMVRVSETNLSKGLVFGVLDVPRREIIWLELPFTAQTVRGIDNVSVEALLHRLEAKLSIGKFLELKARAQHLELVPSPTLADEAYTYQWALNPANVSQLLF